MGKILESQTWALHSWIGDGVKVEVLREKFLFFCTARKYLLNTLDVCLFVNSSLTCSSFINITFSAQLVLVLCIFGFVSLAVFEQVYL